jgi:antitoxin component of MazEF toxin-antitoxin module
MYVLMENAVQVAKWGNSLAVRLPAAVVDALKLKEGDEIEIHVAGALGALRRLRHAMVGGHAARNGSR